MKGELSSPDNSAQSEATEMSEASAQSDEEDVAAAETQPLEESARVAGAPYSTASPSDSSHCIKTMAELRKQFGAESYKKMPDGEEGILCYCGATECLVAFNLYKYKKQDTSDA